MINKLKLLSDTAHKTVADLHANATVLNHQLHKAIMSGADDKRVDAIELAQKLNCREIIRATENAIEADTALEKSQSEEKAIARKLAVDEFTKADNELRKTLAIINDAATAYINAVARLGPGHVFNPREQARARALALNARFRTEPLPIPTVAIRDAHRTAAITIEWLNSRTVGV